MSTTHRVAVHREGRYWVAVVDGLRGGATEVRTLAALEVEVRDLISALTDTDPESFELDWDYGPALPAQARAAVHDLDEWRARLAEAETRYAKAQAAAAASLSANGVSVRDTASLLHVSPARVVQLTPTASRTVVKRTAAATGNKRVPVAARKRRSK